MCGVCLHPLEQSMLSILPPCADSKRVNAPHPSAHRYSDRQPTMAVTRSVRVPLGSAFIAVRQPSQLRWAFADQQQGPTGLPGSVVVVSARSAGWVCALGGAPGGPIHWRAKGAAVLLAGQQALGRPGTCLGGNGQERARTPRPGTAQSTGAGLSSPEVPVAAAGRREAQPGDPHQGRRARHQGAQGDARRAVGKTTGTGTSAAAHPATAVKSKVPGTAEHRWALCRPVRASSSRRPWLTQAHVFRRATHGVRPSLKTRIAKLVPGTKANKVRRSRPDLDPVSWVSGKTGTRTCLTPAATGRTPHGHHRHNRRHHRRYLGGGCWPANACKRHQLVPCYLWRSPAPCTLNPG